MHIGFCHIVFLIILPRISPNGGITAADADILRSSAIAGEIPLRKREIRDKIILVHDIEDAIVFCRMGGIVRAFNRCRSGEGVSKYFFIVVDQLCRNKTAPQAGQAEPVPPGSQGGGGYCLSVSLRSTNDPTA